MKFLERFKRDVDSKIIERLRKRVNDAKASHTLQNEGAKIIEALNPLYRKYATILQEQLSLQTFDVEKAHHALVTFSNATLLSYSIFRHLGDVETQKKLLDYYTQITNNKIVLKSKIMEHLKFETLLRTTILDMDKNNDSSKIEDNLNKVQDYLFEHINNKKEAKNVVGEMALLYFVRNNKQRANEYLQMYYDMSNKKVDSIVATEIKLNVGVKQSEILKNYIHFVEDFIETKELVREIPKLKR